MQHIEQYFGPVSPEGISGQVPDNPDWNEDASATPSRMDVLISGPFVADAEAILQQVLEEASLQGLTIFNLAIDSSAWGIHLKEILNEATQISSLISLIRSPISCIRVHLLEPGFPQWRNTLEYIHRSPLGTPSFCYLVLPLNVLSDANMQRPTPLGTTNLVNVKYLGVVYPESMYESIALDIGTYRDLVLRFVQSFRSLEQLEIPRLLFSDGPRGSLNKDMLIQFKEAVHAAHIDIDDIRLV